MSETLYANDKTTSPCSINGSCRSFNQNLNGNDPATQYQRQKIIQNTVRVKSSLYTMNLAALSVYQRPNLIYKLVDTSGATYVVPPGVNWNQMSDRKEPHVQRVVTASGSGYGASSTKRTIVRLRPGALSPGGSGVDIKHNSYDRYLNRIKGKGPVRRGLVPANYGSPYIPFNKAFPVYGGKTIKTSIVSGCDCPITDETIRNITDTRLYGNSDIQNRIFDVTYTFNVGDFVWAKKYSDISVILEKATIISIVDGLYTLQFSDGTETVVIKCELLIYYNCGECLNPNSNSEKEIDYSALNDAKCYILTALANGELL